MKNLTFVTGNEGKRKEVQTILTDFGLTDLSLKSAALDLPELQGIKACILKSVLNQPTQAIPEKLLDKSAPLPPN